MIGRRLVRATRDYIDVWQVMTTYKYSTSVALSQQQLAAQTQMMAQMQEQASARDKAYADLLEKFQDIGVNQSSTSSSKKKPRASTGSIPNDTARKSKPAKPATASKQVPTPRKKSSKSAGHSSTPRTHASTSKTTQGSSSRSRSTGPPKPSPKRHPGQLNSKDWPPGYEKTKNCFFAFIKLIWGLIEVSAVPKPPDQSLLTEFNARFSESSDIEVVLDSTQSQDLVDKRQVRTLSGAKGVTKVGPGLVNIKEFFVLYAQAMFAKIGIRVWGPDLDAPEDTLWNEACRISAIRIFRQWAISDAFVYMNINKSFVNNLLLLERTYNHYVHYYLAKKYKVEAKEEGKNQKDVDRKSMQCN